MDSPNWEIISIPAGASASITSSNSPSSGRGGGVMSLAVAGVVLMVESISSGV